jgi:hypothetical protein
MLNPAEKRLLAEWMDLGGKYYNDPFDANAQVRDVKTLDQASFEARILPILNSTCASNCHMAVGSNKGGNFRDNRFVLTGSPEGDYNVTLTMISNTCQAANNPLLQKPSTAPHPTGADPLKPPLPTGSASYNTILQWIAGGCPTP